MSFLPLINTENSMIKIHQCWKKAASTESYLISFSGMYKEFWAMQYFTVSHPVLACRYGMGSQFGFSVRLDNKVLAIRIPAVCGLVLPPGKSQK